MKLTLPRLVTAITFLSIFAWSLRLTKEPDTWWHLRTGQWIVEHGEIPRADPFSHTRTGEPWRIPGWIVQVPMFELYHWLGFAGLNLFTACLVTLTFIFVYRTCEGAPLWRAAVLLLAAAASGIYWSPRPQLVSFSLAAVFAYVLHRYRWHGVNRLWLLPPLMTLWANAHGGFAIGFVLLVLTLAAQVAVAAWRFAIDRSADRVAWRAADPAAGYVGLQGIIWIMGTGLACAAFTAINPFGPEMLLYPFKTVSIGVLREWIQEWQAPNFHIPETHPFLWLLLGTFAVVGLSRRPCDFTDVLLVCGTSYMAFLACRNMVLLSIVAPPLLTRHGVWLWEDARQRLPNLNRASKELPEGPALVLNWLVLLLLLAGLSLRMASPLRTPTIEAHFAGVFPVGAVEYIRQNKPPGKLFNSYNLGAYLTWWLYPEYPVYVDGRTDLYNDAFLREYLEVTLGREVWREAFARHDIRLVVIERDLPLTEVLRREPGWKLGFEDARVVVFVKLS